MISYVYCSDHPDCYPSVREVVSLVVVLSLSSRPNARASVQHGFVQLERFNNCADGDCFMGTDSSLCASVHAASLHAFFRLFFARLLSTVSRAVPLYVIFSGCRKPTANAEPEPDARGPESVLDDGLHGAAGSLRSVWHLPAPLRETACRQRIGRRGTI